MGRESLRLRSSLTSTSGQKIVTGRDCRYPQTRSKDSLAGSQGLEEPRLNTYSDQDSRRSLSIRDNSNGDGWWQRDPRARGAVVASLSPRSKYALITFVWSKLLLKPLLDAQSQAEPRNASAPRASGSRTGPGRTWCGGRFLPCAVSELVLEIIITPPRPKDQQHPPSMFFPPTYTPSSPTTIEIPHLLTIHGDGFALGGPYAPRA